MGLESAAADTQGTHTDDIDGRAEPHGPKGSHDEKDQAYLVV
jgi:hypothetical protein